MSCVRGSCQILPPVVLCMCKADGETVDHLFLHCLIAKGLWDMAFALFGVQ